MSVKVSLSVRGGPALLSERLARPLHLAHSLRTLSGTVLLHDTGLEVQCAGFDRAKVEKGVERVSGVVDCVQHVQGRLLPLPNALNPVSWPTLSLSPSLVDARDDMDADDK